MEMKRLTGTVVGRDFNWCTIECPNAPAYLQVVNLRPWQARSAQVGDVVILEYRSTPYCGNWIVTDVIVAEVK